MSVGVFLAHFEDALGYDLSMSREDATIQDYLNALNDFQEKHVASCRGCDGCCWERIPLTSIDIMSYLAEPAMAAPGLEKYPPLTSFVHKFCHVLGQGPVVDITLGRHKNGACIFLDPQEKICLHHSCRSLVCQTFVCLPHSERAGRLRDTLLNTGEDDLVRRYLLEAKEKGEPPLIHENIAASPCPDDYPPTAYAGKSSYREIRIKDLVPAQLWTQLYVHAGR